MLASENCALDVRGSRVYTALCAVDNAPTTVCTMHTSPTYTANMTDEDGNVTTVVGSLLNYQRELIEGHEDIVVEDAFMMVGYGGFFGEDQNNNANMPGAPEDTDVGNDQPPDTDDLPPDMGGFFG